MRWRVLALLLALVMLLGLTACGGKDEEDEPEQSGEPQEQAETDEEDKEDEEDEAEKPAKTTDWTPGDDVTILVSDTAGSLCDITARVLAQYLERYIGQLVNVENVPGGYTETNEAGEVTLQAGAGTLGWRELAGRKADGLTLGYMALPDFTNALFQWQGVVSEDDYVPVCTHTTQTAILIVREEEGRFHNLKQMVRYGRLCNNPLVAATDGDHGLLHAWTQLFAKDADMPYTANPQGSVGAALQCLRDGAADFAVVRADDILERDEGLQVLGVFGSERLELYPDVPTLSELGFYPDWLGCAYCVVAPAGTDEDAVIFYEQAFREAMGDARYLSASSGVTTDYKDAADTAALLSRQRRIALRVNTSLWW